MKIYHVTDTHCLHEQLITPTKSIDVMVHTGDATNQWESYKNEKEFFDFIDWYKDVHVNNKIYVAGNHDSWVFHNEKQARREFESRGIIYLNKEEIVIDGVKFYGDPMVPRYGNWYFMADRSKMNRHWEMIPEDVNVLLTHTPPKGILDLSEDRQHNLEMCGCSALTKKIKKLKDLKASCFGHIHNFQSIVNTGLLLRDNVQFSNATAVVDAQFDKGIQFHGNIIEI